MGFFANPTHNAGEKVRVARGQDCCLVLNYNPSTSNTIYKVTSSSSDYNKVLWSDWNYVTESGNEHSCPITYNSPSSKSSYAYSWGDRGLTGDYLYHLDEVISRADLETYYDVLAIDWGVFKITKLMNGIRPMDILYDSVEGTSSIGQNQYNAVKVAAKLRYITQDEIGYGSDMSSSYNYVYVKQYTLDHSIDPISTSYTVIGSGNSTYNNKITRLLDAITYQLWAQVSNTYKSYFGKLYGSTLTLAYNIGVIGIDTANLSYGYLLLCYTNMDGSQYGSAIVSVSIDSLYICGNGSRNIGYNTIPSSMLDSTYGGTHIMVYGNTPPSLSLSVNGVSRTFQDKLNNYTLYLFDGDGSSQYPGDTGYIYKNTFSKTITPITRKINT